MVHMLIVSCWDIFWMSEQVTIFGADPFLATNIFHYRHCLDQKLYIWENIINTVGE